MNKQPTVEETTTAINKLIRACETLAENSVLLTNRVLTLEARVKTLETKGGGQ